MAGNQHVQGPTAGVTVLSRILDYEVWVVATLCWDACLLASLP